jgi:hypothetical protein
MRRAYPPMDVQSVVGEVPAVIPTLGPRIPLSCPSDTGS